MDPDEPAAGPVGEDGGTRARAKGDRAVHGVPEPVELVADEELAARRRPARLPHSDGNPEDLLAPAGQRRCQMSLVDDEARSNFFPVAQRLPGHPPRAVRRQNREANLDPYAAPRPPPLERRDEVRRAFGGPAAELGDRRAGAPRRTARDDVPDDERPPVEVLLAA